MADQKRIILRSGHATPKNIVLYALPVADASAGTTIYLTELHATPKNIILRNPATAPVTGAETGESAAPLSAVASIVAAGQKAAESAAPLSAVATVTAEGQKGEDEASPLNAVATITAVGFKAAESTAQVSAVAEIVATGEAALTPVSHVYTPGYPDKKRAKRKRLPEEEAPELPPLPVEQLSAAVIEALSGKPISSQPASMVLLTPAPVAAVADEEDEDDLILLLAA